ncbi:MarR family winged helix-turn-helix transcriptional regulator [Marinibacterium profundimaris]|uniref:MarR family winged helix-turn-helix transcriptional regulator n=1 Tax=Marinibacterium profundimaris TaxID=1679460 RepID=UPI000B520DC5|nr:MarR family transcriptional regulator [Marinibacterium profundimaris]
MNDYNLNDDQVLELRHNLMRIVRIFMISERRFPVGGRNARYSPHDFHTLSYLAEHKAARAGEIGRFLEVAPTTMTGVIDRMEAADLIERVPDESDARATRLILTDAGWAMHASIVNQDILNISAMMGALDQCEQAEFRSMVTRISARIEHLI